MLLPSEFARPSAALARSCNRNSSASDAAVRFELLTELNEGIYKLFAYVPNSTKVDSPIEEALRTRQGVCQDFAHIMIALVRPLGHPLPLCERLSVSPRCGGRRRIDPSEGASHAWVEALVPRLGWVAFDPTNNLIGADRHIRVAIGRDYADVPPTRGVYKGEAHSKLSVAVTVSPSNAPPPEPPAPSIVIQSRPVFARGNSRIEQERQQQQ